jgi:hypothetical protein
LDAFKSVILAADPRETRHKMNVRCAVAERPSGCMLARISLYHLHLHPCLLERACCTVQRRWSAFYLCASICLCPRINILSLGIGLYAKASASFTSLLVDQPSLYAGRLFEHGAAGAVALNDHTSCSLIRSKSGCVISTGS